MKTESPETNVFKPQSKTEYIYKILRQQIRDLELEPGSRLNKNEIALKYGISRGPVSEAINRLAEEGLVDVYPQSGTFVSQILPQDVRESLLIRTGLEVEAVRHATGKARVELARLLDKNLDAQAAAIRDEDIMSFHDLDEAFHAAIFDAINSTRAKHMLIATRAMIDRPRFHNLWKADDRMDETLEEHRRIVDAIRDGDTEAAAVAMRAHLTVVAQAIEHELVVIEEKNSQSRSD